MLILIQVGKLTGLPLMLLLKDSKRVKCDVELPDDPVNPGGGI